MSESNAEAKVPDYNNSIFGSVTELRERLVAIFASAEFQQFVRNTQYSGFDPLKTREDMLKKFGECPSAGKNSLEDDVTYLVNLFLKKGSNIYAITKKMSGRDNVKVTNLRRKYGIVPSVKDKGATAITLPRIAAAFPLITANILVSTPDDLLTRPFSANKMKAFIPGYPKVLMCNATASIIPNSLDKEIVKTVKSAICCYTAIETAIINRDFLQNLSGAAEKCEVYVTAAHESSLLSEETRMAVCKAEKVFGEVFNYSDDGEINSVTDPVKTAAEFWLKFVNKEFTYDDLQTYL